MYFLLGLISTVSIPVLLAITGTDVTVSGLHGLDSATAARKLAADLTRESDSMEKTLPTLKRKVEELVVAESRANIERTARSLPKTIATDDKTQGTLAGTLLGKATISPNAFTGWTAVFTVLTTAIVKAFTLSPQTFGNELSKRYTPILEELLNIDWSNPRELESVAREMVKLYRESGVEVSPVEAVQIMKEI